MEEIKLISKRKFYEIKKRRPNSFYEDALLRNYILSKQKPFNLEQKREQILRIEFFSNSHETEKDKRCSMMQSLKFRHPDWSEDQIKKECNRLVRKFKRRKEYKKEKK